MDFIQIASSPCAIQLRYLQTLNSIRYVERSTFCTVVLETVLRTKISYLFGEFEEPASVIYKVE